MSEQFETRWRRHGRLLSLLRATSERLGDRRLRITHTDPSLLDFDARKPCEWLSDFEQVGYLLGNHRQIVNHGHDNVLRRLLLVPSRPPVHGPLLQTYFATVKAVIHLQLYEGVRLWIAFVRRTSAFNLSFSHSIEQVGTKTRVWPSMDYYCDIESHEAAEATTPLSDRLIREVDTVIEGALPITAYRDENFLAGKRVRLPQSWRRMLWRLSGGKCEWCPRSLAKSGFQVDHARPLHPEEDHCRPTPAGNTNVYNLAALCAKCNRDKSNKNVWFPESLIPTVIPDPRIADYFRGSLVIPPSKGQHRLPSRFSVQGQVP